MKGNRLFYKSSRWNRKRTYILRRDEYRCQEAKRYGKHREAVTVHHIYPLSEYPELAFENWNLLSLSNEYHNKMHDRTTGKITEAGRYWQKKREKELKMFRQRYPPTLTESREDVGESRERTLSNSAKL